MNPTANGTLSFMPTERDSNTLDGEDRRKLAATRVQLSSQVERTSEDILQRYRENKNWKLYQKEWIYRNLFTKGMEVLDFGCGTGQITSQLAALGAKKVYGVDVTQGLLDVTAQRCEQDGVSDRVEVICDFIQNIEPRPVDLVIAFAVLHHCHPIPALLPQLLKWLRPSGTFVCVEPIVYFDGLEKARVASGVPFEPLDEGERKLDSRDLDYVSSCLDSPERVHFRLLGRADRWLPDRPLRRIDHLLLKIPGMSNFAGGILLHGKKKHV